jgi:oligoribonuclease NrnB/cAMP/cGMP phosphodiesterase (DHH superfamily)
LKPNAGSAEENQTDRNLGQNGAVVVSHRKDADGLTAAAIIRYMTKAKVYLTDYSDMVDTLSKVPNANEIFICDLGLNKVTFPGFLSQIERLSACNIHYFDHHPIDREFVEALTSARVELYHSTEESAAMLIYKKYEELLSYSPHMKILACCGAITDYMDLQPFAKKIISSFDRQFLLYEATVLSFSIAMIGRTGSESNRQLIQIVSNLASEKYPHEIENASNYAQEFASHSADLIERVRKHGKRMNNFAYFKTEESSTGNVANFLIGAFGVPVGVAFRQEEPGYFEISTRSSEESRHDLGKILRKISSELETSGGGHRHAAGARIRKTQFDEFLSRLDQELSNES